MNSTLYHFLIAFPEITASIAIVIFFYNIFLKNYKETTKTGWYVCLPLTIFLWFVFYFMACSISSIWIEYPNNNSYVFRDNQWHKFENKILHKPFDFDGYKIDERGLKNTIGITLTAKVGLKIHYQIEDKNIIKVLDQIGPDWSDHFPENTYRLILSKLSKILISTPVEKFVDDKFRLEVFKNELEKYGITVDQVDLAYLTL